MSDQIVNAGTGEVVGEMFSEAEARNITEQIKQVFDAFDTVRDALEQLLVDAYQGRVWVPLGYGSWVAYCDDEVGLNERHLDKSDRQVLIVSLREAGLSTRAIASAVGVNDRTVRRDLDSGAAHAAPDGSSEVEQAAATAAPSDEGPGAHATPPAPTTGTDGKTYASPAVLKSRRRRAAEMVAENPSITPAELAKATGVTLQVAHELLAPAKPLASVPDPDSDDTSIGEIAGACPVPGDWAKACDQSEFGKFMDRRLVRTKDTASADDCPAKYRAGAERVARDAAVFWLAFADALATPIHLTAVED